MAAAEEIARRYFDAVGARDLDALAACWAADGLDRLVGQAELRGPEGVRAYFEALFAAFPDFAMRVTRTVAEGDRVAVQWRATGTFAGPGRLNGIEPTGAQVAFEGIDLLEARDGLLVANEAFADGLTLARQIGLLPPAGSPTEVRLNRLFNGRTRLTRRLHVGEPERVADGVWLVRGGFPLKTMNVYLVEEEGGGVATFDAGIEAMTDGLRRVALRFGGITRVVLGHAHPDHRGAAPGLGAPVYCHAAERASAEGDAGMASLDLGALPAPVRAFYRWSLADWDGGPVTVAGTFAEGDEILPGFRAVHVPGHAPGMVAAVRERDGLALSTDTFYTLDVQTTRKVPPRVPHPAFTPDVEQARASVRKLAGLDLRAAWPGHAEPVVGDVRAQLERAAAA